MIGVEMARKRNTLGCLFYLALVLLVLVVFLFNRARMQEVIDKTGLTRLFKNRPQSPPEVVVSPLPAAPGAAPQKVTPPEAPGGGPPPEGSPESRPGPASREVVVTVEKPPPEGGKPAVERPTPRTRQSRLFFVAVGADGEISLRGVIRSVRYVDTPLTATLQALLEGPTAAERNQGLISLLSPDTRLRGVTVKGDTAVVDFSEAFRFSSLGKDGLAAELRQVVYTATEFSNVKKVRVLIEGRPTEYLGPEGVFVGEPLGRESFSP
jgi:germination protein M